MLSIYIPTVALVVSLSLRPVGFITRHVKVVVGARINVRATIDDLHVFSSAASIGNFASASTEKIAHDIGGTSTLTAARTDVHATAVVVGTAVNRLYNVKVFVCTSFAAFVCCNTSMPMIKS
jgi:hypothetical protein